MNGGARSTRADVFDVSVRRHAGRTCVEVAGDIDVFTAPLFSKELSAVIEGGARSVAVGVGGVEFADSTFVHALVSGYRQLRGRGGELVLESPRRSTLRLLELCGLDDVIPIC